MLKSVDLHHRGIGNFNMSMPSLYQQQSNKTWITNSTTSIVQAVESASFVYHEHASTSEIPIQQTLAHAENVKQRPVSSSASQHASQAKPAMHPTMKNFLPVAQPA